MEKCLDLWQEVAYDATMDYEKFETWHDKLRATRPEERALIREALEELDDEPLPTITFGKLIEWRPFKISDAYVEIVPPDQPVT